MSPDHPDDETFEGFWSCARKGALLRQRPAGRRPIRELVAAHKPRILVLDFGRVFDIEYSALQMMTEGERRFAQKENRRYSSPPRSGCA